MSAVKLPSTTKKRQKGVVAQATPIQANSIRIARPGRSVGTGPGQGRMEGERVDAFEQHRLDTMQAPPMLRVEEPSIPVFPRGGRGGGRGMTAPRGGRGGPRGRGRGRGVDAVSGTARQGPDREPVQPGSNPPPLVDVVRRTAGHGPGREPGQPASTRPTYPSLRPVVLPPSEAESVPSFPRNYAPAGAYARVLSRLSSTSSSPAFIVRDKDAYSPSRPTPMELEHDVNCEAEEEILARPTPQLDVNPEAEEGILAPPASRSIVDYTSQVKTETGTGEVNELDDDEEAEPDDSLKQSSTLVLLKSSKRPEIENCWSKDSKLRESARKHAYCAIANELSEKDRRPVCTIWRDDGVAVDWILDHRAGSLNFMFPRSMLSSSSSDKQLERARRVWMEKKMVTLRQKFPSRKFGIPIAMAWKMRVFWTVRDNEREFDTNNDRETTQPGSSLGKRVRSPSPTTARKLAKTSQTALLDDKQTHQSTDAGPSGVVPVTEYFLRQRLPVGPVDSTPSSPAAIANHLDAAIDDIHPWTNTCLSNLIQSNREMKALGEDDPVELLGKHRRALIAFVKEFLHVWDKREFAKLPGLYHENCTVSLSPSAGEDAGRAPSGEPGIHYYRALGREAVSNRNNHLGSKKYSDIIDENTITQYLTRNRAKKAGIWWISFKGFLGTAKNDRHFLWSYRRTLIVWVDYVEGDQSRKQTILADYMLIKRHGETPLPSGWRWISDTKSAVVANGAERSNEVQFDTPAAAIAPGANDRSASPNPSPEGDDLLPSHPIQPPGNVDGGERASARMDDTESKESIAVDEVISPLVDVEEDDESLIIPLAIEDAASEMGQTSEIGNGESDANDEQAALQKQMEAALEHQHTWQEIRAAAPNAKAAVKKLAELEEEIVSLHMRLVALRKGLPPRPPHSTTEQPLATSSTASATTGSRVSDLHLTSGIAHPLSRMAGDKIRFMLKGSAQTQGHDIAVYSMRGVVQHISDRPTTANSRAVSTILENGLKVVDGCMPTMGTVVMVVERNAVAPVTKNPQQLLLWNRNEEGHSRQTFLPKAPHSGNPSCIVAIGHQDNGSYRFASGGTTDRKVILWDIKAGGKLKTSVIQHHSSAVRSLAFEPTRQHLFGGTTAGHILVQDLTARRSTIRPTNVQAAIFHIHTNSTSPDCMAVEAEQTREQFYIFDTRTAGNRPTHRFGYDVNLIPKATLSRFDKGSFEGDYFVRGFGDGTVRMWDVRMLHNRDQTYMVAKASNDAIRHVVLYGRKLRVLTQAAVTTYDLDTQS